MVHVYMIAKDIDKCTDIYYVAMYFLPTAWIGCICCEQVVHNCVYSDPVYILLWVLKDTQIIVLACERRPVTRQTD